MLFQKHFMKGGGGCGRFWRMLEQQPPKESSKVLLWYDGVNRYEQYVTVKKRRRNRYLPPQIVCYFSLNWTFYDFS